MGPLALHGGATMTAMPKRPGAHADHLRVVGSPPMAVDPDRAEALWKPVAARRRTNCASGHIEADDVRNLLISKERPAAVEPATY